MSSEWTDCIPTLGRVMLSLTSIRMDCLIKREIVNWPSFSPHPSHAQVVGPKLMENRKPFQLKNTLIVYNLFQVLFSTWLFYEVRFFGFGLTTLTWPNFTTKKYKNSRHETINRTTTKILTSKSPKMMMTNEILLCELFFAILRWNELV